MAIELVVNGQTIEFPSSAESPNWSSGVIQFAQAVTDALSVAIGPYDIPPQVMTIDAYNPGTNINVLNLAFSTATVRSANIRYAVYRSTSSTNAYEAGNLTIVYNPDGPVTNKWEIERDFVGNGQITFSITDAGQVRFTTATLAGTSHTGRLSYSGVALLQS